MIDMSTLPLGESTPVQVAGGWLLFVDMILCAVLFAFWDKAARIRIRLLGRRKP